MNPATRNPRRHPAARLTQQGDDSILVGEDGRALILNTTALALWELCDGITTIVEMVNALNLFFDADQQVIHDDVVAALDDLAGLGFLQWVSPDGPEDT